MTSYKNNKLIYNFAKNKAEGNTNMKDKLGGKGANLAEMCNIGINVPPGFTIITDVCNYYYNNNKELPSGLDEMIKKSISDIESNIGTKFGSDTNPLLFSVRSGAKFSMPGMMDTILNLGLNDITVEALAKKTNNKKFAYDSYRRFIQIYSDVVLNIDHYEFENILDEKKLELNIINDVDFTENDFIEIVKLFKEKVKEKTGNNFPQDIYKQLFDAINAVFLSWNNDRAITYRNLNKIDHNIGTAINIQSMVFGNKGNDSATGVLFTRNPSTGEKKLYGEYLINAQGEDVVAGIRTPQNIHYLKDDMKDIYDELQEIYHNLEIHYKDMQDIEFTIEENKLWILQTRNGKRTAKAAIKIAVDLFNENILTKEEAILKINPEDINQLLHKRIDESQDLDIITHGLPASPGAASGIVVFDSKTAEEKSKISKVILVRKETSPDDIKGMHASEAIITSRGGMTSHAAVVARGMGVPCICGVNNLEINEKEKLFTVNDIIIKEGDTIAINGSKGDIIKGSVKMIDADIFQEFKILLSWCNDIKKLNIRANAETEFDCLKAKEFNCEGIGLCRTEHMFFNEDRINHVREMIVADNNQDRNNALDKLLPYQIADFTKILKIMEGLPVNIRLLDPPLHEFLPHDEKDVEILAKITNKNILHIKSILSNLKEENPMLGHRGCRLGISYPEIYNMQIDAIFTSALKLKKENNIDSNLEIMIPLISDVKELEFIKNNIIKIINKIEDDNNIKFKYQIGTMIELPRAALTADKIAHHAEFFSFGTNDLTQTTFGMSRDDSSKFLRNYKENNIIKNDPFASLDTEAVGELIKIAQNKSKKIRPNIKIGICGEHGGDPDSIEFCNDIGLNYVSCSPYRIYIAKIAAAIAQIKKLNN